MATRIKPETDQPERADACGHVSRFDRGFNGCPAFEPETFQPATFLGQPLRAAVTCRHLTVEGEPDKGPFYPRCLLGGLEARRLYAGARRRAEDAWGEAG